MNFIRIDGDMVDVFLVAQAHDQLESDYNVGGILRERPSNQRRRESTGCQLHRLKYKNPFGHVDISAAPEEDDQDGETVRFIYLSNALKYGLPLDADARAACRRIFTADFLTKYPQVQEAGHVH